MKVTGENGKARGPGGQEGREWCLMVASDSFGEELAGNRERNKLYSAA